VVHEVHRDEIKKQGLIELESSKALKETKSYEENKDKLDLQVTDGDS
jgi:hypothetical protein